MKTETKHTPGPWTVQKYTNYKGFSVWAANRGCIAERWYDQDQGDPYGSEIEGNAKLIAAAPDLLEACKGMVDAYGQCECVESSGVANHCPWCICRAALAKCEPQQADSFYIFVDRGNGQFSSDGCWGGEHNHFASRIEAYNAIVDLSKLYPDCDWVMTDQDKREIERIKATIPQPQAKGRWDT